MKYSRMFFFFVLMTAVVASFGAYDGTKPADNEYVADVPALVRENFRALKDDAIVNAGTVAGLSVGNASGNIPRSNGTLNTNLNSDMLDGYHASAFNASDALNVRLDGSRAMTGSLKFSGNYGILQSTGDGADSGEVNFGGGGSLSVSRGAYLRLFGNESASTGQARYFAGNVSGGHHVFYTGNSSERLRIGYDGTSKFSGDVILSGGKTLHTGTDDSSDNSFLTVAGGGANSSSRGAEIDFYGNEHTVRPGHLVLIAGNDADGGFQSFWTQATERMRLTYGGNLLIGTMSDDGTNKLQVKGPGKFSGDVILSGGKTLHTGTDDSSDNSFLTVAGGGANSSSRGAEIDFYGNEHTVRPGHLVLIAGNDADGGFQSFWTQATERMRLTYGGNLLIGTMSDDGTNKLQVNGPVYIASYVSALGYIDRTEAPDTLAEAYAIVQSHEVTADGELDHSKLHPAAWGKRVELRPTGNTITRTIEEPIQDAGQIKVGSQSVKEKIIEEPEMEQIVVPDQSGRDLSMVISAQALVIKDLTKRIEALEATR